MKNPNEILRQKERQLEQVKREIEALHLVAPMLVEENASPEDSGLESLLLN